MKHTPGPWKVSYIPCDEGLPILTASDVCVGFASYGSEERANAALMASAPDLLAACRKALARLQECEGDRTPDGEKRENVEEIEALSLAISKVVSAEKQLRHG